MYGRCQIAFQTTTDLSKASRFRRYVLETSMKLLSPATLRFHGQKGHGIVTIWKYPISVVLLSREGDFVREVEGSNSQEAVSPHLHTEAELRPRHQPSTPPCFPPQYSLVVHYLPPVPALQSKFLAHHHMAFPTPFPPEQIAPSIPSTHLPLLLNTL